MPQLITVRMHAWVHWQTKHLAAAAIFRHLKNALSKLVACVNWLVLESDWLKVKMWVHEGRVPLPSKALPGTRKGAVGRRGVCVESDRLLKQVEEGG